MTSADDLDLEDFRSPDGAPPAAPEPLLRPPHHKPGEAFLKGPIPWSWLEAAMRLPGKALHVAVLLWQEAGCRKGRTVRFRLSHAARLGMHLDTARRGLRSLADAGLITIRHHPGECLEVTLLKAPAAE
jgi:hypothetical protein